MAVTSRANNPVMRNPGNDKKDINADITAGQPWNARVKRDDEENRRAAKAFDVGSESGSVRDRGHLT